MSIQEVDFSKTLTDDQVYESIMSHYSTLSDDSYSIEVANINVGDTIEWLPKNEGHNVEFLAGPNMEALPENSDLNVLHRN